MSLSSRIINRHIPCPHCDSSDAYCTYDDGHGYCFSCKQLDLGDQPLNNGKFHYEYLPWRGINKEVMEFYGVRTKIGDDGRPIEIGFNYPSGSTKVRPLDRKDFYSTGPEGSAKLPSLFGMDRFNAGSARSITITEGELDALSVYQISRTPAVSVRSSSSARKDCQATFEYLNSFDRIYLALDNDEQGKLATSQIASLFDFNKVYHVKITKYKDANEFLTNGAAEEFRHVWNNAGRFLPDGIISSFKDFDDILDARPTEPIATFPFEGVQEKTYGIFPHKAYLITAPEGVGKTEFLRRNEHHWLKTTDINLGYIHLEEDKARQLRGLAGYEVEEPLHLPDRRYNDEQIKGIIRDLVKRDDRLHLYTHFGSEDPDVILEAIRFLVAVCGCKIVTLDHITQVVTGLDTDDTVKLLDKISTRLSMMLQELDFALVFISHVNDDGKTRGSRMISKMTDLRIDIERDILAEKEDERNRGKLVISKNRITGRTGPAGFVYFDPATFMVNSKPPVLEGFPPTEEQTHD